MTVIADLVIFSEKASARTLQTIATFARSDTSDAEARQTISRL